jgi:hypothetical protein
MEVENSDSSGVVRWLGMDGNGWRWAEGMRDMDDKASSVGKECVEVQEAYSHVLQTDMTRPQGSGCQ